MQYCEYRDAVLSGKSLDALLERSLSLVKTNLFENASFVNSTTEITLRVSKPQPRLEVVPDWKRIYELDGIDIYHNGKTPPNYRLEMIAGLRGVYVPGDGKIYLHRGKWCIETIIHELLHACSITGKVDLDARYTEFIEGLTEFYTGYILFKAFPEVYENCWRKQDQWQCQMTYPYSTRLWGAFCRFIPVKETVPIYFYDRGSTNYTQLVDDFVKRVRALGYTKFESPLTKGAMPIHEKFKNVCKSNFSGFDSIYGSHEKCTDFKQLKE